MLKHDAAVPITCLNPAALNACKEKHEISGMNSSTSYPEANRWGTRVCYQHVGGGAHPGFGKLLQAKASMEDVRLLIPKAIDRKCKVALKFGLMLKCRAPLFPDTSCKTKLLG
jgi:hypothetical protein